MVRFLRGGRGGCRSCRFGGLGGFLCSGLGGQLGLVGGHGCGSALTDVLHHPADTGDLHRVGLVGVVSHREAGHCRRCISQIRRCLLACRSFHRNTFDTFNRHLVALVHHHGDAGDFHLPGGCRTVHYFDGRNRLKACRELGIKTMAVEYSGEKTAVQVITDLNIYRRHLTASQRAAYGLRLLPVLEHEAKERKKAGVADHSENIRSGRAVDLAGAQVGVNGRYIEDARTVANSSPELLQRLISGEITIPEAKKQIRQAKATPVQPEQILFSVGEAVARLLELIPEKDNPSLVEIAEHSPTAIRKAIEARLNPDTAEAPESESIDARAGEAPVFNF